MTKEIKYPSQLDGRKKLTEAQRLEIVQKRRKTNATYKALSEEYKISKSMIAIIVNPKRAKQVCERIKKHWRDYKKTKEARAADMRKYRARKMLLGYIKTSERKMVKTELPNME